MRKDDGVMTSEKVFDATATYATYVRSAHKRKLPVAAVSLAAGIRDSTVSLYDQLYGRAPAPWPAENVN